MILWLILIDITPYLICINISESFFRRPSGGRHSQGNDYISTQYAFQCVDAIDCLKHYNGEQLSNDVFTF